MEPRARQNGGFDEGLGNCLHAFEFDIVVVRKERSADLAAWGAYAFDRRLIALRKLEANLQGGMNDGQIRRMKQAVEVHATRVYASVTAMLQENLGEGENGDDELAVSIFLIPELHQAFLGEGFLISVLHRCPLIQQQMALEVLHLELVMEVVSGAESVEKTVKAVQERDPVVQVAARERPSCRKLGKLVGY